MVTATSSGPELGAVAAATLSLKNVCIRSRNRNDSGYDCAFNETDDNHTLHLSISRSGIEDNPECGDTYDTRTGYESR